MEYRILPPTTPIKLVSFIPAKDLQKSFTPNKVNSQIPKSMDLATWGTVNIDPLTNYHEIVVGNGTLTAHVQIVAEGHHVVSAYYKGFGRPIIFVDKIHDTNPHMFTRTFKGGLAFQYSDGVVIEKSQQTTKQKFIKSLLPQAAPNNKVITMDLETREVNGSIHPICISVYMDPAVQTGKKPHDKVFIQTFAR